MPVLLNILPNIYWMYNNPSAPILEGEYGIELRKVQELYNIKTLIELDGVLAFWNKSNSYINDIKSEIEKNEFSKLLVIYKKLLEAIKKAYLSNAPMIISTYKADYVDVGLGVWIYFFHISAGMAFDNVIKLLGLKVIGAITMTDTLKKFFAFLNMKI